MTTTPTTVQAIEALLFYEGGTVSMGMIQEYCIEKDADLQGALSELAERYSGSGLTLIITESDVSLRVAPVCTALIEQFQKDALTKEVGPASLEVLSILLYRGPSTQADIDAIRGVHSAVSLRNLRMRGLISVTSDQAKKTYTVTTEALAHLGVTSRTEIPNYAQHVAELEAFEVKAKGGVPEIQKELQEVSGEYSEE
jgi:segregation and condensation protein B